VCKLIEDCPGAYEELLDGKTPVGCGFINFDPIICCPRNRVKEPKLPIKPIDPPVPSPRWNESRVARAGK